MSRDMHWGLVSKYRSLLFSLSAISIIVFHFWEDVVNAADVLPPMLTRVGQVYNAFIGSIGTEVFIFLSGVGIYFSLSKGPRISDFYKRRFTRLLFPYILIGGIFWLIRDGVILHRGIKSILHDFLILSFFTEGKRTAWYIVFQFFMYALAPAAYLCNKLTPPREITGICPIGTHSGSVSSSVSTLYEEHRDRLGEDRLLFCRAGHGAHGRARTEDHLAASYPMRFADVHPLFPLQSRQHIRAPLSI